MLLEKLLKHPATEISNSSMLQYREPGIVVLNRAKHGTNSYPILGHIATFERHPVYINLIAILVIRS